ncbi:MAG TPA: hypothetical protein VFT68_07945 [Lapillicoccus sp.]|nr:hypothetical protein [Lapillicoccus sp.]
MTMVTVPATIGLAHDAAADAGVRPADDLDEEFFALVYSDSQLLRAEFEAIVEAAWSSPPPLDPTSRGEPEPVPAGGTPPPPPAPRLRPRLALGMRDRGSRTRSPPGP